MVKRKCGTCKFFKNAGMAGSGWCEHPQRVELQNLVMVRKSELACRNGWDQDLWQPAETSLVANGQTDTQLDSPGIHDGASMLAERDEALDTVVAHNDGPGGVIPDESDQRSRAPKLNHNWPGRTRQDRDDELQQDRMLPYAATDSWKQRVAAAPKYDEQSRFSGSHWSKPELERSRKPGFARLYETRQEPRASSPEQDRTASAEPEIEHGSQATSSPDSDADRLIPQPVSGADHHRSPMIHTDGPERAGHSNGSRTDSVEQQTEPLPTDAVNDQLSFRFRNDSFSQDPRKPNGHGEDRWVTADKKEPFIHVDGPVLGNGTVSEQFDEQPQSPALHKQSPVDREARLASIPRCCGTCRDFRRNGDGETGVCMNPYAFSDRPMVKSDQLACRSSVGVWWLPHDDVWLERADTLHHTRPTPHLDAALGANESDGTERDLRSAW